MKRRVLALALAVVLCCSVLTGCMGVIGQITILEDGSGTYKASLGYTQEGLEMMAAMNGEMEAISTEGMTAFNYNGYTYYGQVETAAFATIEELDALLNSESEESGETATGATTTFSVVKKADGTFTLSMILIPEAETTEEETDPETKATVDALMEQMTVVYEITFPSNITQTQGNPAGVTINGNQLILDIIAIGDSIAEETVFEFSTVQGAVPVLAFTDVVKPAWYYDAVMVLANGGLVAGIGNNLFDPEGALTYAQFCQILARAKGLPTGAANDYWAYTAIESCLDAGYILDRGPLVADNYDIAIPREAAVSAMYLAKKAELTAGTDIEAAMIPDYHLISDSYKENVLSAYNSGITSGVDDLRAFKPQDTLTRAQVCQLFYNLNWTSAE